MAERDWTERHIRELIKNELKKIKPVDNRSFTVAHNKAGGVGSNYYNPINEFFGIYQITSAKFTDSFVEVLDHMYYPKYESDGTEYIYSSIIGLSKFDNNCIVNSNQKVVLISPYDITPILPSEFVDGYTTNSITPYVIQNDKIFGLTSVLANSFKYKDTSYKIPPLALLDKSVFYYTNCNVFIQSDDLNDETISDSFVASNWSDFDWSEEEHTIIIIQQLKKIKEE